MSLIIRNLFYEYVLNLKIGLLVTDAIFLYLIADSQNNYDYSTLKDEILILAL